MPCDNAITDDQPKRTIFPARSAPPVRRVKNARAVKLFRKSRILPIKLALNAAKFCLT